MLLYSLFVAVLLGIVEGATEFIERIPSFVADHTFRFFARYRIVLGGVVIAYHMS